MQVVYMEESIIMMEQLPRCCQTLVLECNARNNVCIADECWDKEHNGVVQRWTSHSPPTKNDPWMQNQWLSCCQQSLLQKVDALRVGYKTLGTMVPQFAYWSIGSFLHPCESQSPSHSCIYKYDHSHSSPSTLLMSLSHFYHRDADLSASAELA